jgi:hypothetical protein
MTIYQLDPLQDARWPQLVERHPAASVFHTRSWLAALRGTYGYTPIAFTTSGPDTELTDGVVFCAIRSWLTGKRLVSLPFSDHCEPLVGNAAQLEMICAHVRQQRTRNGWRYVEIRTRQASAAREDCAGGEQFWFHVLDLRPDTDVLFRSFHKDSIQRKIRRAERENLTCHEGCDEGQLRAFYGLLTLTRQRHQLPPPPFAWFRHLAAGLGTSMTLRIARFRERPVAAMVTLFHRGTAVYKYGASDAAFHQLGGMPWLFWKAIQEARARGCLALDLGRSDFENSGLTTFKDRFGAARSSACYWRSPAKPEKESSGLRRHVASAAKRAFMLAPDVLQAAAGRVLYRHVG